MSGDTLAWLFPIFHYSNYLFEMMNDETGRELISVSILAHNKSETLAFLKQSAHFLNGLTHAMCRPSCVSLGTPVLSGCLIGIFFTSTSSQTKKPLFHSNPPFTIRTLTLLPLGCKFGL